MLFLGLAWLVIRAMSSFQPRVAEPQAKHFNDLNMRSHSFMTADVA